jgi:hypothetical protein
MQPCPHFLDRQHTGSNNTSSIMYLVEADRVQLARVGDAEGLRAVDQRARQGCQRVGDLVHSGGIYGGVSERLAQ